MNSLRNLILLFSLALLLAACGQDQSPAPPSAPATPERELLVEEATSESIAASEPAEPDCQLLVGWDPWEPYHYAPVGGHVQGLDIDLLAAMADLADCQLEYMQGSWASLLQLIRSGDLDLLLAATLTSEREEFARFSEPYRQESFRIFVRSDERERWADMTLDELLNEGFRLGLTQGYIYGEEVSATLAEPRWREQLVEAAVGELNFLNLMDYSIDGFIEDPFVATSIGHRRDWGQSIEPLDAELYNGNVRLMFSRESTTAATVERFDQALSELRANGRHQQILNQYLN